jgi:hypothetical protein
MGSKIFLKIFYKTVDKNRNRWYISIENIHFGINYLEGQFMKKPLLIFMFFVDFCICVNAQIMQSTMYNDGKVLFYIKKIYSIN